ncbi:SDR family oxidoreductase [Frateuria defendens]|uniref:SDR family oxidoreductase n=1 Tax=Frateuria defendens TaxID=2219559 RepID=UPI00066FB45C|nr:SDR family oxidoreductase [Frateuria defendens]
MSKLNAKQVLIIGGSSGIGEAAAKAFAELGAAVTIASRSRAKLDAAATRIGHGVTTAVLDTTDNAAVEAFFAAAGAFDHVVVSASQTPGGPVRELPLADAYKAMDSKFWGAYRVARAATFKDRGSLTLVSGFLSVRPGQWVLQGAINAAIESLGRGLALELAPVRVNTVSPGVIATPLWSGMDEAARRAMYEKLAATLPARTLGQPEDVANAIVYLATTPYATGSTVLVDGGGAIA